MKYIDSQVGSELL